MDSSEESSSLTFRNEEMNRRSQKSSFGKLELFQQSLQKSSNITSHIILNETWKINQNSFNGATINKVLNSAQSLLKTSRPENIKTWKSSLSKFDPISTFEKSIKACQSCATAESYVGFKKFINNECNCGTCHVDVTKNKKHQYNEIKSMSIKEHSNNSSQESKVVGDQNFLLKSKCRQNVNYQSLKKPENSFTAVNSEDDFREIKSKNSKYNARQHFDSENIMHDNLDKEEEDNKTHKSNVAKITFKTAKEALLASNPAARRTLGASRKAQGKFVSPMIGVQEKQEESDPVITDDRLKHIDPKMVELIESEIIDNGTPVGWDDIAGLQMAKSVIQEAVVWPLLRPDIFTGLRRPPKGILLFGPPGTGKTLIGKCVAAQCNATFFSISASSLTSKWLGDGEKMVRALFAVASCHQPAVIFIDEIDSLLTQRSDSEHEATRRIKTEFLVQFDGAATGEDDRLLIVGATNRPQELDEAARRRLVKRLYIPLPDIHVDNALVTLRMLRVSMGDGIAYHQAREQIISNLLKNENNELSSQDIKEVASLTEGYSGADMKSLCSEAAMGPIRSVPLSQIISIERDKVRPVNVQDFINALQRVRPSVSQDDLGQYVKWNKTYGQGF